jgi:hypothetical protein
MERRFEKILGYYEPKKIKNSTNQLDIIKNIENKTPKIIELKNKNFEFPSPLASDGSTTVPLSNYSTII